MIGTEQIEILQIAGMEQTVELVCDKDISNEQVKSARWYAGLY